MDAEFEKYNVFMTTCTLDQIFSLNYHKVRTFNKFYCPYNFQRDMCMLYGGILKKHLHCFKHFTTKFKITFLN